MPYLEVVTRHMPSRPQGFAANCASLASMTDADYTHTVLVDSEGRGVEWANVKLGEYGPRLVGDYIWVLDDDDMCVRSTLVEELKAITTAQHTHVVMLRNDVGWHGVLPPDKYWRQPPEFGRVAMSCFVVKREVWQAHAEMFGAHLGADHAFISTILRNTPPELVYWHDVIAMRSGRISRGTAE